ncbi:DUF7718 family protein [Streptomyces griseoluteus]|uniref:DUF7718 family protein n=1 Tax=Streptomyces griseoluteus TaxID=29306 RepID=UPI00370114E2
MEKPYVPPPREVCTVETFPIYITADDRLTIKQHVYKGKIVHFAIMQDIREGDIWHHVARIDCCHGTIHRHQYNRAGDDIYDSRVITEIPADNGWSVVDAGYQVAQDAMFDEYEENLRRWRDGA